MPLAEGGVEWASGSGLVPGDALAYDSLSLPSVSKTPHVLETLLSPRFLGFYSVFF